MKRNSVMTQVSRIAALRARSAYRQEKAQLLSELREARQRGLDQSQFLAELERAALMGELLGRRR